jgi:hypothetical protein
MAAECGVIFLCSAVQLIPSLAGYFGVDFGSCGRYYAVDREQTPHDIFTYWTAAANSGQYSPGYRKCMHWRDAFRSGPLLSSQLAVERIARVPGICLQRSDAKEKAQAGACAFSSIQYSF